MGGVVLSAPCAELKAQVVRLVVQIWRGLVDGQIWTELAQNPRVSLRDAWRGIGGDLRTLRMGPVIAEGKGDAARFDAVVEVDGSGEEAKGWIADAIAASGCGKHRAVVWMKGAPHPPTVWIKGKFTPESLVKVEEVAGCL